jgi:hypothetical protein
MPRPVTLSPVRLSMRRISPKAKRLLVYHLGRGTRSVPEAARAAGISPGNAWDAIAMGGRGHTFYRAIHTAYVKGQKEQHRRELAIVEGGAELLLAGTSVRETAKLLRVPLGLLRSILRRALGRVGHAPEPHLQPLADAASARTRPGWRSCPRCKACGAPLRMTPRARRAA